MNYIICDLIGGVPEGRKYEIADTPETEKEWKALLSAFAEEFSALTVKKNKDFEFADWHYEMRSIFACLYNEEFYREDFIPRVQGILKKQNKPCFAKFECFNADSHLIGHFMVFEDKVIFSRMAEEEGLLRKLIPKQQ